MAYATFRWTNYTGGLSYDPSYLVDGILTNYASEDSPAGDAICTTNQCDGTDLGTISAVEIRAYGYAVGDDDFNLQPQFNQGLAVGDNHFWAPTGAPAWGSYFNITLDSNAPSPWTWTDIQNLYLHLDYDKVGPKSNLIYVAQVEVRVTYTEGDLSVNVYDTTTVTDDTTVNKNSENVYEFETTTITDVPTVERFSNEKDADVYDSSTVTDVPTMERVIHVLDVSVYDETTITESLWRYDDEVTVTESVTVEITTAGANNVNVHDDTTTTDDATVTIPTVHINVYDTTTVTDYSDVSKNREDISVYEETTITDYVNASTPTFYIYKYDNTTTTDYSSLAIPIVHINVNDGTSVTDVVSDIRVPTLYVDVSDSTAVTDYSVATKDSENINVYDETTVTDVVDNAPLPYVLLDTPANEDTVYDATPDFVFTGYDAESDDLEYNIQIDTSIDFDSQSGDPLHDRVSIDDQGFSGTGDPHPWASGVEITYTLPNLAESFEGFSTGAVPPLTDWSFYTDHTQDYWSIADVSSYGTPSKSTRTIMYTKTDEGISKDAHAINDLLLYDNYTVYTKVAINTNNDNAGLVLAWGGLGDNIRIRLNPYGDFVQVAGFGRWSFWYEDPLTVDIDVWYEIKAVVTPSQILCYVKRLDASSWTLIRTLTTELSGYAPSGWAGVSVGGYTMPTAYFDDFTIIADNAVAGPEPNKLENGTYYWRVRAIDPDGGNEYGAWSETRELTVNAPIVIFTQDYASPTDVISVESAINISVYDESTITEDNTEYAPILYINSYDTSTVTDTPSFAGTLAVYEFEETTVTDEVDLYTSIEYASTYDDVTAEDSVSLYVTPLNLSVYDDITVEDVPYALVPTIHVSTYDSTSVTDATEDLVPTLYIDSLQNKRRGFVVHLEGMSDSEIDDQLALMAAAHTDWIRLEFSIGIIEQTEDVYVWDKYDYIVNKALSHGIQILGMIVQYSATCPVWARVSGSSGNYLIDPTAYVDLAGEIANRYDGDITYYELGNEPNATVFWGNLTPSASDYVNDYVKPTYTAIKTANANNVVVTGGITLGGVNYATYMFDAGLSGYYDLFGTHPYNEGGAPTFSYVDEIQAVMSSYGDGDKKQMLTEVGWSTYTGTYGVSDATQADYLEQLYQLTATTDSETYRPVVFWYDFKDDGTDPDEHEHNFGVVEYDLTPKLAYAAFRDDTQFPADETFVTDSSVVYAGYWRVDVGDIVVTSDSRVNMITNSSFESAGTWLYSSQYGTALWPNSDYSYDESNSGKMTLSEAWGAWGNYYMQQDIPVTPGVTYTVSAYYYIPAATVNVSLAITLTDSDDPGWLPRVSSDFTSVRDTWTRISKSWTIPEGTTNLRVILDATGNDTTDGSWYWDAVLVEKSSTLEDYISGTDTSGFTELEVITNLQINVYDDTATTDAVSVNKSSENISVYDSSTVTDAVSVSTSAILLSDYETTNVTDDSTVSIPTLHVNAYDTSTVTDTPSFAGTYAVYEYEETDVTDSPTLVKSALDLSVYDDTTVSENIDIGKDESINVYESVPVTDGSDITLTTLDINVHDDLSVTDTGSASIPAVHVSAYDVSVVTEGVSVDVAITSVDITVYDSSSVTDHSIISGVVDLEIVVLNFVDSPARIING